MPRPCWHGERFRPRHLGVLGVLAGVGAYATWCWIARGNPVFFWEVQGTFGHRPLLHPATWVKLNLVTTDVVGHPGDLVHELASLALLVATVAAVPTVVRRLGAGYGLLALGAVATTWASAVWFAPAGRYLLPVVPVLLVLVAQWVGDRVRVGVALVGASATLQLVLAAGFAGGFALNW